jgi:hypothetical protein
MEYISYDTDGRMIVRCKLGCKVVIAINNTPLPEYCELVIAMRNADGQMSKHETGMCRRCKDRILTHGPRFGELDDIYAQDIEQWIASSRRAKLSDAAIEKLVAPLVMRKPLRELFEAGRGES